MYLSRTNLSANDQKKERRKSHPEPDKNIRGIKLCRYNSDGVYKKAQMEGEAKAGGKALPGQDYYQGLEGIVKSVRQNKRESW